jgi:hypothetical protein
LEYPSPGTLKYEMVESQINLNSKNTYNLIFTTKFNDSSILITIISWDYLNLSLADENIRVSE